MCTQPPRIDPESPAGAQEHSVAIAKKKLEMGKTLEFAGFIVSEEGVKPNNEKIKALSMFPAPTSLTELRSFLGLANQLGGFVHNLTQYTDPLRTLLRRNTPYKWTAVPYGP